MKKLCTFLLIAGLLFSSALAEYEQYRLAGPRENESPGGWEIFPLDEHNVIVRVYRSQPWHTDWYRDGRLIRMRMVEPQKLEPPLRLLPLMPEHFQGCDLKMRFFLFTYIFCPDGIFDHERPGLPGSAKKKTAAFQRICIPDMLPDLTLYLLYNCDSFSIRTLLRIKISSHIISGFLPQPGENPGSDLPYPRSRH